MTFVDFGYFEEKTAKKIAEVAEGKTFYNFKTEVSGYAGNFLVTVSTERKDTTVENLRDAFACFVMTELASA